MGGDSVGGPQPPTDYTAAMVNASNNQLFAQLSQSSTQQLLGTLMAGNQSQQIMTNGQVALAGLDAKLDIAKLNFTLAEEGLDKEFDKAKLDHEEKMEELRVRDHEATLAANQPQPAETVDTGFARSGS